MHVPPPPALRNDCLCSCVVDIDRLEGDHVTWGANDRFLGPSSRLAGMITWDIV